MTGWGVFYDVIDCSRFHVYWGDIGKEKSNKGNDLWISMKCL